MRKHMANLITLVSRKAEILQPINIASTHSRQPMDEYSLQKKIAFLGSQNVPETVPAMKH